MKAKLKVKPIDKLNLEEQMAIDECYKTLAAEILMGKVEEYISAWQRGNKYLLDHYEADLLSPRFARLCVGDLDAESLVITLKAKCRKWYGEFNEWKHNVRFK